MALLVISLLKKLWAKYSFFIGRSIFNARENLPENEIWRNRFLVQIIKFVLPLGFSFLAINTLVFISQQRYACIWIDTIAFSLFVLVCLSKKIKSNVKKLLGVLITITLSVLKILMLSSLISGSIFLFSLSLFATLLFHKRVAYLLAAVNAVISLCCSVFLSIENHQALSDSTVQNILHTWTSSTLNLTFLNLVTVCVISYLISDFEKTLSKKRKLYDKLSLEIQQRIAKGRLLQEAVTQYRSLFFLNPLPMVIYDPETLQFLQVNNSAIANYGYSESDFMNMKANEVLHWDETTFKSHIPKDEIQRNYQHFRKDGTPMLVDVKSSEIIFNSKTARLAIMRDITAETAYLDTIALQNKNIKEIAFIQSHLIRSPLSKVMGITKLLSVEPLQNPAHQEMISYLLQSSEELDNLVVDIIKRTENGF